MKSYYKGYNFGLIDRVVLHAPRQKPKQLVNSKIFNATTTSYTSIAFHTEEFLNFTLYNSLSRVKNGGSPQMTLKVQLQFTPDGTNYYDYVTGPFGSLIASAGPNDSIGSGLTYCLDGRCAGGAYQVHCTATGTDADNTITLDSYIEFW